MKSSISDQAGIECAPRRGLSETYFCPRRGRLLRSSYFDKRSPSSNSTLPFPPTAGASHFALFIFYHWLVFCYISPFFSTSLYRCPDVVVVVVRCLDELLDVFFAIISLVSCRQTPSLLWSSFSLSYSRKLFPSRGLTILQSDRKLTLGARAQAEERIEEGDR